MALMRKRSVRPDLKAYSGKWASIGASDLISQLIAPGGSLQVCVCELHRKGASQTGMVSFTLCHRGVQKTLVN